MAAGFKTGVPTTTGVGQGSAQVFAPTTPRVLDTTALQRGVGAIVDADAANKAAKAAADKKAKEDKAKAEADAFKAAQDAQEGIFPKHQELFAVAGRDLIEDLDKAESTEERENILFKFQSTVQGIKLDQNRLAKEFQGMENNTNRQSYVDGKYIPYYDAEMSRLNESPTEFELGLLRDGTIGGHLAITGSDAHSNTLTYDPEFNPQTMALDMFTKWAGSSETSKAYLSKYSGKEGTNIQTIIKDLPAGEEDNFREWMKQQEIEKLKWATNSAIENGYPPYVINDPQFKKELDEGWNSFVDGMILPSQKKTSQSTKNDPTYDKDAGKPKDFKVTTSTLDIKTADGRKSLTKDVLSTFDEDITNIAAETGESEKDVTTRIESKIGEEVSKLKGNISMMTMTSVGTGKDLSTITVGTIKGIPERVYYNEDGGGFVLMKVPMSKSTPSTSRYNKTTGKQDVTEGGSTTVMDLQIVPLRGDDLKRIQTTYGYEAPKISDQEIDDMFNKYE